MLTTSLAEQFQNLAGFCRVHKLHRRESLPIFKYYTYLLEVFVTYRKDQEQYTFSARVKDQMGLPAPHWKLSKTWDSGLKSSGKFVKKVMHTHTQSNFTDFLKNFIYIFFSVKWQDQFSARNWNVIAVPFFSPWLYERNLTLPYCK